MPENNHLSEEQIALCAEAINSDKYDELPRFIRKHLVLCNQCSAEIMMVSEVFMELEEELPINKKKRRVFSLKPIYVTAISVAAAAIILFIFIPLLDFSKYPIVEKTEDISDKITVYDTIPAKISDEQIIAHTEDITPEYVEEDILLEDKSKELIAAFVPNESLEQLYNNMKGTYRGRVVNIKTPHTINFAEKDSLNWSNPDNTKLYVEFFNNKGNEIKVIGATDYGVAIPEFSDGLYYWKLISADFDLLFVGKIIVNKSVF